MTRTFNTITKKECDLLAAELFEDIFSSLTVGKRFTNDFVPKVSKTELARFSVYLRTFLESLDVEILER